MNLVFLFRSIFRNFARKPATNLINLFGLVISLSLVIILSLYCYSEFSSDRFHKNGERVYLFGMPDHLYTPGVLKESIDQNIPGVEACVRLGGTWEPPVFEVNDNEPVISDLIFSDENFFKLFTYRALEGNLETALKDPLTIVITKGLSDKLFGTKGALGKIIRLNNDKSLTVSAVIEEPKENTCLKFSALTSMATRKIVQENGGEYTEWGWCDFQTFCLLRKGSVKNETEKAIVSLFPVEMQKDYENAGLTPMKNIYFSKFEILGSNYLVSGDRQKTMVLIFVAALVLIIALINFINISTSQWQSRIRQTGVLKIMGAGTFNLLFNIIAESFFYFLAAFLVALQLVSSVTFFVNGFTGIKYNQNLLYAPGFYFISLLIILLLSILFSIIPAFRISSSRAVDNLKKSVVYEKTRFTFRGFLVVLQFAIAIVMIAFTLLVQKQVRYGTSSLGFNQKNIVGIKLTAQMSPKKEVLRNLLASDSRVRKVSFSQYFPGNVISLWTSMVKVNGETRQTSFDTFCADENFFKVLGLQLLTGRFYSDSLASDKKKLIVNETFLRENKIVNPSEAAIIMGNPGEKTYNSEIVGVIKDFRYNAINKHVGPLVIRHDSYASYCLVDIITSDFKSLKETYDNIRKISADLSPSFPVEVKFIDQAVNDMYGSEIRFRRAFSLLSGCAIVICCLGILAISILGCQRRVKEIGIRKTNGAETPEILLMLNSEFFNGW